MTTTEIETEADERQFLGEPESKRDRFVRVVEPRVLRAIKAIEIIGLIGGTNKYSYDFGESDVEEIAAVLHDAVDLLSMKLGRRPRQLRLFELSRRPNGGAS
jgi:hypothetical protein